jgi:hypothetical protein
LARSPCARIACGSSPRGTDASLGDHSTLAGSSIHTEAELWVAKDGLYPVSGTYSAPSGDTAQSGSFSYTFDVTYINDATLIQAIPTPPDK